MLNEISINFSHVDSALWKYFILDSMYILGSASRGMKTLTCANSDIIWPTPTPEDFLQCLKGFNIVTPTSMPLVFSPLEDSLKMWLPLASSRNVLRPRCFVQRPTPASNNLFIPPHNGAIDFALTILGPPDAYIPGCRVRNHAYFDTNMRSRSQYQCIRFESIQEAVPRRGSNLKITMVFLG
jgi:hypothetical protein